MMNKSSLKVRGRAFFKNMFSEIEEFLNISGKVIHGIFVFCLTVICGLAIYGLHIPSALQLGVYVALYSFILSTPAMIIMLGPENKFSDLVFGYLIAGYVVGGIVTLGTAIVILIWRLALIQFTLPQPIIWPVEVFAKVIAFIAVVIAVVASPVYVIYLKVDNRRMRDSMAKYISP